MTSWKIIYISFEFIETFHTLKHLHNCIVPMKNSENINGYHFIIQVWQKLITAQSHLFEKLAWKIPTICFLNSFRGDRNCSGLGL